MHGKPWTPQEEEYLRRVYPTDEPLEEIAAALPEHSIQGILSRAGDLKLRRRSKGRRWTQEDQEYLKVHYLASEKLKAIAESLGRTKASILAQAHSLKLHRAPKTLTKIDLPEVERAYLAGIVDGEGCITGAKKQVRLQITTTDEALAKWIASRIPNCPIYKIPPWKYQKNSWKHGISAAYKPRFEIAIYRYSDLIPVLEEILPYLVIKKKIAELALELARSRFETMNKNRNSISRRVTETESQLLFEIGQIKR